MERVIPVVVPVFALILAGYAAAWRRLIGEAGAEGIGRFVYFFALPALIFVTLGASPIERILEGRFIAAFSAGLLLPGLLMAALTRLRGIRGRGGVDLLLTGYPNIGYMGIPFFLTAFGPEGALPAMTGVALQNILIIPLAVPWMGAGPESGRGAAAALRRVVGSPLIYSVLAGVAVSAWGGGIPVVADKALRLLGGAAGPGGLFCVGLALWGKPLLAGGWREIAPVLLIKLLLAPAIAWFVGSQLLALAPVHLFGVVFGCAMPIGANAFVLAQNSGQSRETLDLVGGAIFLTTALSLLTLSLLLWILPPP
ncbi:MAG: AEC family transporter [bacterium]